MIYFLIYLFLEVWVSYEIAAVLGPLLTFVEIIASAFLGIVLLLNLRHTFSGNLFVMMKGGINQEEFAKNNLYGVVGAFLLIIPGLLTDIIGLLLQFQALAVPLIMLVLGRRAPKTPQTPRHPHHGHTHPHRSGSNPDSEEIIDVEIIDSRSS